MAGQKSKPKNKKLSPKEVRNGIILFVCIGLISRVFKIEVLGMPYTYGFIIFSFVLPIIVLLNRDKSAPKLKTTKRVSASDNKRVSPSAKQTNPEPAPNISEAPKKLESVSEIKESAVKAARGLGLPAILLQPHHPQLSNFEIKSWVGGFPHLPDHIDWPREARGEKRPLHFMAQIDCSTLPPTAASLHGFPTTGHLCFFSEIWEMSETGAVLYFSDSHSQLKPRRPPEDSLPIFGSPHYANPFDTDSRHPIERTGLPHPSTLPLVALQPIEFMSFPEFGHMYSHGGLFNNLQIRGEAINELARDLEAQRNKAILEASNYDAAAAKNAYEALVKTPIDATSSSTIQYAGLTGLLVELISDDAKRFANHDRYKDKQADFAKISQIATLLSEDFKRLPFFHRIDSQRLSRFNKLLELWGVLQDGRDTTPRSYFHHAEYRLRRILFEALVNPNLVTIPAEIKPALMWFQNPVFLNSFTKPGTPDSLNIRGVFQMGGYCHGSQVSSYPNGKTTPLLVMGYSDLTGFKYGDGGDWTFQIEVNALKEKDFSDIYFAADCH